MTDTAPKPTSACIVSSTSTSLKRCNINVRLKSLRELSSQSISVIGGGVTVTMAEAIRMQCKVFDGADENYYVCETHEQDTARSFRKDYSSCAMPESMSPHKGYYKGSRALNYEQTKAIFKIKNILVPPGKPLCVKCLRIVLDIIEADRKSQEEDALAKRKEEKQYQLRRSSLTASFRLEADTGECTTGASAAAQESPGYIPPLLARVAEQSRIQSENVTFRQFAEIAGVKEPRIACIQFDKMNERSQKEHISQAKRLFEEITRRLCPSAPEQLWTAIVNSEIDGRAADEGQQKIMQAVAEAYSKAERPDDRRQLLSLLTGSLSLSECRRHIPALPEKAYRKARYYAKYVGPGVKSERNDITLIRYDAAAVEHFTDYILSNNIMTDLPFGEATLKLSTGERLTVPNVIRDAIPERIIRQYDLFCKQEIKNGNLPPNFARLQRTSLLSILDVCKASKRKALQGLDYFIAAGGTAFDTFETITYTLMEKGDVSTKWKNDVVKELKLAKDYLKTDYKGHLAEHESVPDHCLRHALSDKKSTQFQVECGEKHDQVCGNCNALPAVISEIYAAVKNASLSNAERADVEYQLEEAERDIYKWKAHQLRAINQEKSRQDIIAALVPERSALLIMDWAMKLLPMWYREDMSKFFGKVGMPWHVIAAVMKNYDGSFCTRTLVHNFDRCKQNSDAVCAILTHALEQLKDDVPTLSEVFLRSDNAGCYHSAQTILTLPAIAAKTGIIIKRFDFSEPQGGKADCDRAAATIKRHVNMFVAEKHNCSNGKEFVHAVESHGGVRGVSIHHGELSEISASAAAKIAGIRSLNNFLFTVDGIQAWKAYNIGNGQTIPYDNDVDLYLKFTETYGTIRPVIWRTAIEKKSKSPADASDKSSDDEEINTTGASVANEIDAKRKRSKLFTCQTDGCCKTFHSAARLEQHHLLGNHKFVATKENMKDLAMRTYSRKLQDVQRPPIARFADSRAAEADDEEIDAAVVGWALPQRRAHVRFTEKQRKYLREKFDEGETTGMKYTPEQVAKMMRHEKLNGEPLFVQEEFLSRNQIFSYFCKLAGQKRLGSDEGLLAAPAAEEEDDEDESTSVFVRDESAVREQETISSIHQEVRSRLGGGVGASGGGGALGGNGNDVEQGSSASRSKPKTRIRCAPDAPTAGQRENDPDDDPFQRNIETRQRPRAAAPPTSSAGSVGTSTAPKRQQQKHSKQAGTSKWISALVSSFQRMSGKMRLKQKQRRDHYKNTIRQELIAALIESNTARETSFAIQQTDVPVDGDENASNNESIQSSEFCLETAEEDHLAEQQVFTDPLYRIKKPDDDSSLNLFDNWCHNQNDADVQFLQSISANNRSEANTYALDDPWMCPRTFEHNERKVWKIIDRMPDVPDHSPWLDHLPDVPQDDPQARTSRATKNCLLLPAMKNPGDF